MEFHITLPDATAQLSRITDAVQGADPSAQLDIDASGAALRVSTSTRADELLSLLAGAGCVVTPDQLLQVPSTCCGSCSG